jgi:hypothetical protein
MSNRIPLFPGGPKAQRGDPNGKMKIMAKKFFIKVINGRSSRDPGGNQKLPGRLGHGPGDPPRRRPAAQETRRAGLPAGAKKLNRLKGEVVEIIEDMNRAAKVAYLDSPETAAQLNKSLIQRAKRPKRRLELLAEAV